MNIRQPFIDHYEWTDSIGDWAEHARLTAEEKASLQFDVTPADRYEGVLYTEPQGRREQGWPQRRCSPEMACGVPDDDEDREAMSAGEACFVVVAFCVSACFVAWLAVNLLKQWS